MVRTQETPHFRQTRIVVASAMAQLRAPIFQQIERVLNRMMLNGRPNRPIRSC